MNTICFALFLAISLTLQFPELEDQTSPIDFDKFTFEVKSLVAKYYPQAKVTSTDSAIHFDFNTRKFMIHIPAMDGEWQDAREVIGPKQGGVICDMEFRPLDYGGQLIVPHSFNHHYFTTRVMAPYSKQLNFHLYIHLEFPRNISPKFAKEFQSLTDRFEEFCTLRTEKMTNKKMDRSCE